jgi:hypothetical protein
MKRRRAIRLLANYLKGMYSEENIGDTEGKHLLDFIEKKIGMLPPIEPGRTEQDLDLGIPEWEDE